MAKFPSFLVSLLFFLPTIAISQNVKKIVGTITNEHHVPLKDVEIKILDKKDSTVLYRGYFSDEEGKFSVNLNLREDYILESFKMGYKRKFTSLMKDDELLQIILLDSTSNLDEVVVNAYKPFVERKLDRVVLNVDGNIFQNGDKFYDVLAMGPGISVNSRNEINLNGKNVQVLVDDRIFNLKGESLKSYLNTLDVSEIERIELISNPPAKYDAAGNYALINIVKKKQLDDGLKGSIMLSYGYSDYHQGFTAGNLSLKRGNSVHNLSLFLNTEPEENKYSDNRQIFNTNSSIEEHKRDFKRKDLGSMNYSYQYNFESGNEFGINANYSFLKSPFKAEGRTTLYNDGQIDSILDMQDRTTNHSNTIASNAYFKKGFSNKKNTMEFRLGYYGDFRKTERDLFSQNTTNNNILDSMSNDVSDHLNMLTANVDYQHTGENGAKTEIGYQTRYSDIKYNVQYPHMLTSIPVNFGGLFDYDEMVNAAYIDNTFNKWGEYHLKAGIRIENTNLSAKTNLDEKFSRSYWNIFPSATIQKQIKKGPINNINLSFSRRIARPRYLELNPIPIYASPISYTIGNEVLTPTIVNQIESSFTFLKRYNLNINYRISKDLISSIANVLDDNIFYSQFANISDGRTFSSTLNLPWNSKKLFINVNLNYSLNTSEGTLQSGEKLNNTKGTFTGNIALNAKLPRNYSLQASGLYSTPRLLGQLFYGRRINSSVNLSKTWNNKFIVKLSIYDPFHIDNERFILNSVDQTSRSEISWNSRKVLLGITYLFSKGKSFNNKKIDSKNTEEILRRNN